MEYFFTPSSLIALSTRRQDLAHLLSYVWKIARYAIKILFFAIGILGNNLISYKLLPTFYHYFGPRIMRSSEKNVGEINVITDVGAKENMEMPSKAETKENCAARK